MPTDPPTTTNYSFPLVPPKDDAYRGEWGHLINDGRFADGTSSGSTNGLITELDTLLDSHFTSVTNPHSVTASQTGAVSAVNSELSLDVDISGDADTVDGNHAAEFASVNHNNTQHSTNFLPQSNYNPESDTHSKTSSASELSDVSADSVSGAHHSRYSNEEAQDAVGNTINNGLQYDDANNLINVLAGNALTIDTNGNVKVVESNISHDNIANVSSSDHHSKTSSASGLTDVSPDSASNAHHSRIQVSDSTVAVVTQPTDINFGNNIDVIDDSDGTITVNGTPGYTDSEAISAINTDTDHGSTASHNYFSGSHSDLSGITSNDHHTRYTGSEARSAVASEPVGRPSYTSLSNAPSTSLGDIFHVGGDGLYVDTDATTVDNTDTPLQVHIDDNTNPHNVTDISGDADTVDGYNIQKNGTDGSGIINFKT